MGMLRPISLCCLIMMVATAVMGQGPKRLTEYEQFEGLKNKMPAFQSHEPVPVVDLLNLFAEKAELSVIVGPSVTGTTVVRLSDVTYGDALEIVMALNNVAYEVQGDIVKVMSDGVYQSRNGVSFYSRLKTETIQLKYASPEAVKTMLEGLKSDLGNVYADEKSGTLILKDTAAQIAQMLEVVEKADMPSVGRIVPTITKTIDLDYADPAEVKTAIEEAKLTSEGVGSVVVDARMRQVIIKEVEGRMPAIEALITDLDRKAPQVFIEAKVVEVALTDEFRLGVDWQYVLNGKDPRFNLEAVSEFPGAILGPQGQLSFSTIAGDGALNIVVDALSSVGDTKILSNPHITVTDGEEAHVDVITRQPYALRQFETGSTNITGVSYEFVDVGVKLNVQPKINDDDQVTMAIKPEVSSILSFYDAASDSAPGNTGVPVVKEASAETTITVKDGVTIIIAGMIQEQKQDSDRGVPMFQRIPLLGALFKSKSETTRNTETVVFLTPKIITGEESFKRTRDEKKEAKGLRGVQPAGGSDSGGAAKPVRGLR